MLGETLVTPGNLAVADTSVLSSVVSVAPIYVDFEVVEQSLLDYRLRMLAGKVDNARKTNFGVKPFCYTVPRVMATAYPHP